MRVSKSIATKGAEITKLTASFVATAAQGLRDTASTKAAKLPLQEMNLRLEGALAILRGERVVGEATKVKIPRPQIAKEMIDSYQFDKVSGFSKFIIPAGVSQVEAIKAINEYCRGTPQFKSEGIFTGDLDWYENLQTKYPGLYKQRDIATSRETTLQAVVEGTGGKNRSDASVVLGEKKLIFPHPCDLALAAALHAYKNNGEDLFQGKWIRTCIPNYAQHTNPGHGVQVYMYYDTSDSNEIAASGSPSSK